MATRTHFFALFIPIFLGVIANTGAAETSDFAIVAPTTKTPPKIDGALTDPVWKNAAHVQLAWNFTFRRPADETTDVYLIGDEKYLYVAFVAEQREPIVATQRSNDRVLSADDAVSVYVWPTGDTGNEYGFVANPIGTRYEFSSENTSFAPAWEAVARRTREGYIVTERIPLDVLRGDGKATWRLQFDRQVRASNETFEWAHTGAQRTTDTSLYAGYLNGMAFASHATRTKPRLALYGLAQAGSASSGGSGLHEGADLALPITQTASFIATFHPDYSNVELDQQSISPTVFPRRYSEVRPFFTQGANYYNAFDCNDCLNYPMLYTPNIPTPRSGYALEGTQGNLTFAGFDAIGEDRTDAAQSLYWRSTGHRLQFLYQRVDVEMPGIHDLSDYFQGIAGNAHNFSVFATLGGEYGTQVSDPGAGAYREYGISFYNPKAAIYASYHDVGSQYAPIDGFNQIADAHGPSVYAYKEFDFSPKALVQNFTISQDVADLRDSTGNPDYAYSVSSFTLNTRTQWALSLTAGSNYVRFGDEPGGFTNQNGLALSYGANTSTPSSITYNAGRYGDGFLRSADLQASLRVLRLGTLALEAYKTDQSLDDGTRFVQWLERASLALQIGGGQSVAVGWRRIIGDEPAFFDTPEHFDNTNLSLAYYRRIKDVELYFAFGNPNRLDTQHSLILKLIRYFGADKGT